MLDRLLIEMEGSQTLSVERLATRLNTTPALIQMMLEHLERQGRVEAVEFCQDGCEGCPLGALCEVEKRQRLWQLKHKP
ncbi:MAG: hypothetical protein DDG59_13770 [Anaerolineae bacterium]|jgi:hypothetical protein|nr:MAG: hypothetical protein DDG59_13770 [Anaerolineae bacterium]